MAEGGGTREEGRGGVIERDESGWLGEEEGEMSEEGAAAAE
jgi:hypothetical protein